MITILIIVYFLFFRKKEEKKEETPKKKQSNLNRFLKVTSSVATASSFTKSASSTPSPITVFNDEPDIVD